jgi:hypothetical protein
MSDGMGRELAYLSSHATNRYFIPNWGNNLKLNAAKMPVVMGTLTPLVWERSARHYGHFFMCVGHDTNLVGLLYFQRNYIKKNRKEFIL